MKKNNKDIVIGALENPTLFQVGRRISASHSGMMLMADEYYCAKQLFWDEVFKIHPELTGAECSVTVDFGSLTIHIKDKSE